MLQLLQLCYRQTPLQLVSFCTAVLHNSQCSYDCKYSVWRLSFIRMIVKLSMTFCYVLKRTPGLIPVTWWWIASINTANDTDRLLHPCDFNSHVTKHQNGERTEDIVNEWAAAGTVIGHQRAGFGRYLWKPEASWIGSESTKGTHLHHYYPFYTLSNKMGYT